MVAIVAVFAVASAVAIFPRFSHLQPLLVLLQVLQALVGKLEPELRQPRLQVDLVANLQELERPARPRLQADKTLLDTASIHHEVFSVGQWWW